MARLRRGEKSRKTRQVETRLRQHTFGLHESELANELGWERRTLNNYLRDLDRQGRAYKEGRTWFADI